MREVIIPVFQKVDRWVERQDKVGEVTFKDHFVKRFHALHDNFDDLLWDLNGNFHAHHVHVYGAEDALKHGNH